MKTLGFTLVELLAVLVILSLIFVLVFPSVNDIINQAEDTVFNEQINTILNSAYDFSLSNLNYLPSSGEKKYITLAQLKNQGLIDINLKDPSINENFQDDLVISIYNVKKGYKTNDKYSKLYGNYLFRVEYDNYLDDYINKPEILLNDLIPNSNGDYITTVSLNETVKSAEYKATSTDGIDITDKVVINIKYNDSFVSNIDTSSFGIYYVYYTVVDSNGYSNTITRYIIIGDTTLPDINFPSKTEIKLGSISEFDLLKDVSCTDNSGFCDITISSLDNFDVNVLGTYLIEYTIKDPSGNTLVKKRVISVVE